MRSTLEEIEEGKHKLTLFFGEEMSQLEVEELVRDILCGYLLLDGEISKHNEDLELVTISSPTVSSGKVEFTIGTRFRRRY